MNAILVRIRTPLLIVAGFLIGLSVAWIAGENPLHVAKVIWRSAFGSRYDFGMTLFYTTPLIFTGLAVSLPYRAGLFNIGAEGQLTIGAFSCAAFALSFPSLPPFLAILLGGLAAFLAGAFWGAIPGWIRAYRGGHEVITTILLNFVAAGVVSYFTLYKFKTRDSQNPETPLIPEAFHLKPFEALTEASVTWALPLAILISFLIGLILWKTVLGFYIRAVGENERAARYGGIPVEKVRMFSLALGGGFAGLVGIAEVLGASHRFRMGFSPDYGFTGIAVAFVARGNPFWVIPSAFLFGALHKGASDLELETENLNRDIAMILQAVILLVVTSRGILNGKGPKK